jgi:CRP-like cAMP-binding protein
MPDSLDSRLFLENRLLAVLSAEEKHFLEPLIEPVSFSRGEIIYQAGDAIRYVYFPSNGMISLLSVTEQGHAVEIGFTGKEGMLGLPAILGQTEMPDQALVQIASDCLRVEAKKIINLFDRHSVFHDVVLRYAYILLKQYTQTCVCNHFHTIEARLCRWLTVMCERSKEKHLLLTQEFLAHILGVQRTSVGMIANDMQNRGIIRYRRGKIEILDFERIKSCACECYLIIKREHEDFLD